MARKREHDTLNVLQQARDVMEFTLAEVAHAVGSNEASISRIERGMQMGRREIYRALFAFYGGIVPLGALYDPNLSEEELDKGRVGKLRKLAKTRRAGRALELGPGG